MIVEMKKIFLLMSQPQAKESLDALRSLGVLHVEHEKLPGGQELNALAQDLSLIEHAQSVLSSLPPDKHPAGRGKAPQDWRATCHHIIDLQKRYAQLKEYSVTLVNWIDQWQVWGDFDPHQVRELKKNNIFVKLCQVPKSGLKQLPQDIALREISAEGKMVNCLVLALSDIRLPFKEMELPKSSLSSMRLRLEEDAKIMQELQQQISDHRYCLEGLVAQKKALLQEKCFYEALKGMGEAGPVVYVKGYIPSYVEEMLLRKAKEQGWGILTCAPAEDDAVPTLVRNPAWAGLIRPLLKLLEIIPGYRELDISPLFLIFFSLFFGMLIGDAGYGLLYLIITFLVHKRLGGRIKDKAPIFLFYLLSSCAIIWGILAGAFFGQSWLLSVGIKPLVPAFNNISFIQAFCFLVGALHLSIAHGWRLALKLPSLEALADLGWICIIWAAFFLAKSLLLGDSFPFFGSGLIFSGLTLVLFFTSPQRNILKGIGAGLGTIALGLVNNFTDVVSYVRLFAVGLATVAIADAFNAMAYGVFDKNNLLTVFFSALIAIIGHALNMVLGPMSVLVHGVRLNVLEFCSHANVTWSGFAYKPLSRESIS